MFVSSDSSRMLRTNANSWDESSKKEYGINPRDLALEIFSLMLRSKIIGKTRLSFVCSFVWC
jgi:hypothetical protein